MQSCSRRIRGQKTRRFFYSFIYPGENLTEIKNLLLVVEQFLFTRTLNSSEFLLRQRWLLNNTNIHAAVSLSACVSLLQQVTVSDAQTTNPG